MRYLSILPLLLITALLWGQDTDQKRMKRDIEVAEKILNELLGETASNGFQQYHSEGSYIEGFGVLFTVRSPFGGMGLFVAPEITWDDENRVLRGRAQARSNSDDQKATTVYRFSKDSLNMMDMDRFKAVTETFLADYAYLLTKVPAGEKICIKYAQGRNGSFTWGNAALGFSQEKNSSPGYTAVVRQQAVQDYRIEKIDRKALVNKIEYTETKGLDAEDDRELILLNSIFKRLYQSDLSEGFHMPSQGQMEKIPGLGVVFTYNFSTGDHGNFYPFAISRGQNIRIERGTAIAISPDSDEDDEEEREVPDFEAFLEDFKANVVQYGSTVRNLKSDEVLSFQLQIPDCDCEGEQDWPESVKIVAKQSLLERFRKGNIDLDDAVEQLQVTEM